MSQRSGERQQLALARGEVGAPLAHRTVIALSQRGDELVGPHGESYPIASMPNVPLVILDALPILPVLVDLIVGAHKTLEPSTIVLSSEKTPLARTPEPKQKRTKK